MAKVYVLNNGGHDYSGAAKFGEVVICSDGVIRKDDIAQMFRQLTQELTDFQECDFILVTSLASLCMIAAGIIADRFGCLNLLVFRDGRYVPKSVIFESKAEDIIGDDS
jgi:hypothetical protein